MIPQQQTWHTIVLAEDFLHVAMSTIDQKPPAKNPTILKNIGTPNCLYVF